MLVAKSIVRTVIVYYMIVGHIQDDIDASFGQWLWGALVLKWKTM
jgi:hypothetical protein